MLKKEDQMSSDNSLTVIQDFPTNKPHVSYSEVKIWKECAWRHKLTYVDGIEGAPPTQHLVYGTLVHACVEHFLTNRSLEGRIEKLEEEMREEWEKLGFDSPEFISTQTARAKAQGWNYKHNFLDEWISWAKTSVLSVPDFLESTFPSWELVSAEEPLYEPIDGKDLKFKGFIDAIIKVPVKNGKFKYWILDWKTASPRGWSLEKKRDFMMHAQIALYKSFWGQKNGLNFRDIKTGFVLLKKGLIKEKTCQLVVVSTGPATLEKSNKLVSSMISTVSKRRYLKNKNSCKFCDYYNTQHCS